MDKLTRFKTKLQKAGYWVTMHTIDKSTWIRCVDIKYAVQQAKDQNEEVVLSGFPPYQLIITNENNQFALINRNKQVPPIWRFNTEEEALSFIKEKFPIET